MFLASARFAPTAPLGASQQQRLPPSPPAAWSAFGSRTSSPWGASLFCFPFTMPTPSPPPQLPVASTVAAHPSFSFDFSIPNATSNPFAVSSSAAAEPSLPAAFPARRRESKFAPLLRRKDPELERRKRRDAYMAEVRDRRDAALWETRGDSSLQRDFFDEQRAWEQQQAREAEAWMPDPTQLDEEEFAHEDDETMEEVLPESDGDLDWAAAWDDTRSRSSYVCESDDEYEALMLEIAAQADSMQTSQSMEPAGQLTFALQAAQQNEDNAGSVPQSSPTHGMDMSLG